MCVCVPDYHGRMVSARWITTAAPLARHHGSQSDCFLITASISVHYLICCRCLLPGKQTNKKTNNWLKKQHKWTKIFLTNLRRGCMHLCIYMFSKSSLSQKHSIYSLVKIVTNVKRCPSVALLLGSFAVWLECLQLSSEKEFGRLHIRHQVRTGTELKRCTASAFPVASCGCRGFSASPVETCSSVSPRKLRWEIPFKTPPCHPSTPPPCLFHPLMSRWGVLCKEERWPEVLAGGSNSGWAPASPSDPPPPPTFTIGALRVLHSVTPAPSPQHSYTHTSSRCSDSYARALLTGGDM